MGRMLAASLPVLLLVPGCGGTDPAPRSADAMLPDGCYYLAGRPIFRSARSSADMLIPGPVKSFRVEPGGAERVTFSPGLLLDGSGDSLHSFANSGDAPLTYHVHRQGPAPSVTVNFAAHGSAELVRGAPC